MKTEKTAYICGPLTELPPKNRRKAKRFYESLAGAFWDVTGTSAFVPHQHFDPVKHSRFTPVEVDAVERKRVCECTSLLVVAAIAPSWGGGIEVEMARESNVPVVILCRQKKLGDGRVSRLLRGNPAVIQILSSGSDRAIVDEFRDWLRKNWHDPYADC
ncbi:hypothetical protein A2841_04175 [Candidatus Kaiserbacteria bacterium RIFCSPHIGHO2_01_FULL_48_10]|uniref:Nucleoside 2-deoxyribosyltransferase n=1 Tax=Candidatus Kaiserbacteria bacterium RIFCSPHIGHO2_01_FULL_48_10 TaxID=1798476 RepID=A0A1F6C569_9BACT|nr:MAG: hypothetical protein A2841_04175 [Candidatus Kaiserbacteria bacterium RIFCSPHIGHO2_01_FULL_48_10]